jgi:hypothetical protein
MKFNCKFCQKEINIYSDSNCLDCNVSYRVWPDWYRLFFTQNEYDIEISNGCEDGKTVLWKNNEVVYRLHYMIDINPSNKDYWFDKLINLKAFS